VKRTVILSTMQARLTAAQYLKDAPASIRRAVESAARERARGSDEARNRLAIVVVAALLVLALAHPVVWP
jgi:hypothetical protein